MSLSRTRPPRRRSALPVLAAAGVLAFLLSGCTGDPAPTPTASPDAVEPIFASDEEALAAAVDSYAAHLELVDQLTQTGGADASRVREVATPAYAEGLEESLLRLQESGNHTAGATRFDSTGLVEHYEVDGVANVTVYLCLDVSEVQVLNSAGQDVTPSDRVDRAPVQVMMESRTPSGPERLVVSGAQSWSGDDFC